MDPHPELWPKNKEALRCNSLLFDSRTPTNGDIIQSTSPCSIQEGIKEAQRGFSSGNKPVIHQRYETGENRTGAAGTTYTGYLRLSSQ
jgi:hypothetical protein